MSTEEKAVLIARDPSPIARGGSPEEMLRDDDEIDSPYLGIYKGRRFTWKTLLCVVALVLAALLIVGVSFGIGVVVGKDSAASSPALAPVTPTGTPTPPPVPNNSSNCTCSNNTVSYNWGDYVTIVGSSEVGEGAVPVISWFDEEMSADNISQNLK